MAPARDTETREERRQRAAELYPKLRSVKRVAAELGCAPSTAYLDLEAAGVEFFHTNEPQTEERVCARDGCENVFRPTPRQVRKGFGKFCKRECDHEAHRIHPKPEERVCARPGCGTRFTPEGFNVAMGWGSYCTQRCSALMTAAHKKRAGQIVSCAQCGKDFWRYNSALRRQASRCCSHKCWGLYRWEQGIAISPDVVSLARGRARQRWLGRWAGPKGAEAGRTGGAKGGRPTKATPEEQVAMFRLANEDRSLREIAELVFGDARYKDRVARYLRS